MKKEESNFMRQTSDSTHTYTHTHTHTIFNQIITFGTSTVL